MKQTVCCCDSGKYFTQCCSHFLTGKARPRTAKQLMRSRYTAYALGGYGDYLLATWHPDSRMGLDSASLSIKTTNWSALEIVDSKQDRDLAYVEFIARFLDSSGRADFLHERSRFLRFQGSWFYVDGEVHR